MNTDNHNPAGPDLYDDTILIIDDDPNNLAIVTHYLEESNFTILIAEDGETGLKRADYARPDLILLDIMMPGMDGYETCRRLKAMESTKDIPVIFMTALAETKHKVRGFEAGAVDYITKPFQREEVLARVRTHLALNAMQKQLAEQNVKMQQEIVERRRAEAELQIAHDELEHRVEERTAELARVNRMLKILSECNQALVRATEEQYLLQEICRIIVDFGSYPLVWIGFAEHDAARTVRPVAVKEAGKGNLNTADITWADNEQNQGPTGTAVRSGRPCIVRDIKTDPSFAPWREEAIRRGFASSISLPLAGRDGVFGALNIYATEPDSFHDEEVTLLTELAGDLAYGIMFLRTQGERKRAEEALKTSEKKYRELFEESKDLIFISTPEGHFADINPAGIELLGYSSKEDILKIDISRDLYLNPEDRSEIQSIIDRQGFARDYGVVLKKKDGEKLNVLITASAVYDEKGKLSAHRGIIRDVTNQRRLEEQLLQAQKMESIGTLTGGIAHDFNNILTAIIGYGSLLYTQMARDDALRAFVGHILASAERAANLTQRLLAFSRKQIIKPNPVDVNEIVKSVEKLLQSLIREDIELRTILNPGDLTVMADRGQIEHVLMNLVINARDAMPDGGILTIEIGVMKIDSEYMKLHLFTKPGEYAVISVTDTGVGMDEKTKEKIFEPFFTTKEVGKGTGLGLAVVYGIVKQHEGHINVYSEPGKGTTFKIYLPLIEKGEKEIRAEVLPPPQSGTETILIAEDDVDTRALLITVLEEYGYKVIAAADGEEALEVFKEDKDKIMLVLLDVIMPKKNGREVYEDIRELNPDIKVLFMSGYTADIIHRKGVLESGLDFISKPVSPQELLRKVREVLDKK